MLAFAQVFKTFLQSHGHAFYIVVPIDWCEHSQSATEGLGKNKHSQGMTAEVEELTRQNETALV